MEIEWDPVKAETNLQKHGISFVAALAVFDDPNRIEEDTTRPEQGEKRTKVIGTIGDSLVVAVITTDRNGITRIISVQRARRNERKVYDESKTTS